MAESALVGMLIVPLRAVTRKSSSDGGHPRFGNREGHAFVGERDIAVFGRGEKGQGQQGREGQKSAGCPAFRVGRGSCHRFSRLFKEKTGQSPKNWQKRRRGIDLE
jgi:hypothetical protein